MALENNCKIMHGWNCNVYKDLSVFLQKPIETSRQNVAFLFKKNYEFKFIKDMIFFIQITFSTLVQELNWNLILNGAQPCICYACRKSLAEMAHNKYERETKRGEGRQMKRHAVILWEKERFGRARLKGVGKIHSSCFPCAWFWASI